LPAAPASGETSSAAREVVVTPPPATTPTVVVEPPPVVIVEPPAVVSTPPVAASEPSPRVATAEPSPPVSGSGKLQRLKEMTGYIPEVWLARKVARWVAQQPPGELAPAPADRTQPQSR
jgi:hypothetical protein